MNNDIFYLKNISSVPESGDDMNIYLWIALAVLSVAAIVVLIFISRKRSKYSINKTDKGKKEATKKNTIFKIEDDDLNNEN